MKGDCDELGRRLTELRDGALGESDCAEGLRITGLTK